MDIGDEWFESEPRTRTGLRAEIQRILRRTRVRPFRVFGLAALLTGAIFFRILTKPHIYEANVVLVMSEESLASKGRKNTLPVENLREYVLSVLLPSAKLVELVKKHDMFPLRKTLGDEFAIQSLWEEIDIAIWKNAFVEVREGEEKQLGSARIGITVNDRDPELAFLLANEIASIIIQTAEQQRAKVAEEVKNEVDEIRTTLGPRQDAISREIATKVAAITHAREIGKPGQAAGLDNEVAALVREQKKISSELATALSSNDAIADRITAAGLDMSILVVDEQRPDTANHQRGFTMVLILVIIGMGTFVAAAFVLGAFDSRVHDTDDVERLGLPVLGHVPGFQGDHVGSLEARGAVRSRVPSFLRWRFLQ